MDADDDPGGRAPTRTPFYALFPLLAAPEPWGDGREPGFESDGLPPRDGLDPSFRARDERGI